MPSLFTYIIPIDDGSAPNPFRGMCTLAICKPAIRRVAREGDWVVGVGSRHAPSGDLSGRMVYAMLIEKVITLREYDARSAAEWPHRIPKIHSADLSERLGDCIYDFSSGSPYQRGGVHGAQNIKRDLSGENVLISRHFYYFGSRAIEIPQELKPICPKTQGHRRALNDEHFTRFVEWVSGLPNARGQVQGWPDYIVKWDDIAHCDGCVPCANDSDSEEEVDEE